MNANELNLYGLRCPACDGPIERNENALICTNCASALGTIDDGIAVFNGSVDKFGWFERNSANFLRQLYADYSPDDFLSTRKIDEYFRMDMQHLAVGTTCKCWWEPVIGEIKGQSICEMGCGVNYLVPNWLHSGNRVFAFDICRESVELAREILRKIKVDTSRLTLAVLDALQLNTQAMFDVVDINNALHHMPDHPRILSNAYNALRKGGYLLMVEPNYHYPPRWVVETDMFGHYNFIQNYFVKKDRFEKGEKGIVLPRLKQQLADAGFTLVYNQPDRNYIAYFSTFHFGLQNFHRLRKAMWHMDRIVSWLMPKCLAPFEYIIALKK